MHCYVYFIFNYILNILDSQLNILKLSRFFCRTPCQLLRVDFAGNRFGIRVELSRKRNQEGSIGTMTDKIGVALYGNFGHQIGKLLINHDRARLIGVAEFPDASISSLREQIPDFTVFSGLDELLASPEVSIVSFCSPRRRDQAGQCIRALEAGKHVYAEKPCAMTEPDLDGILATAKRTGLHFHEMAGTSVWQPFRAMRDIVRSGTIGEVIQVLAQKSYPYNDKRPQNEDIDGGLIGQNSIHAVRFVEHVAGVRVRDVDAIETRKGNPVADGGLHMAATLMLTLENGGVAGIVANYLNPKGFGMHGNEHLRIFGTKGFIEAVDGATRTRLVVGDRDHGPIDISEPGWDYFNLMLNSILDGTPMPYTLADELHPTRVVIRAKAAAARRAESANDS